MGKLTEYFDYLNRLPEDIDGYYVTTNYTHIKMSYQLQDYKHQLGWYKPEQQIRKSQKSQSKKSINE